jgi:hypothetical protein
MPVANRGNQAAGLPKVAIIVQLIGVTRLGFPPGSDPWRDLGKAEELLAKHVPPGSVSSGVMNTELQRLQQQQRQSGANTALMRSMGGQGGSPQPQPMPQPQPGA